MNRYELLYSSPDLSVNRFDHPPHEAHCDPEREVASRWAVAFVQTGSFDVAVNGKRTRLAKGGVFAIHPGLEFQCLHSETCPTDICISVAFDPGAVRDHEHAWKGATWSARKSATPRLAYVNRRMANAVVCRDAFQTERWALATLVAMQADVESQSSRGHYTLKRNEVDAVVAACESIEKDPTTRRSIAERAREVGFASTKLNYGFRRYAGVSPHQYVVRYRLIAAADLLSSGMNVSESCYRSGFENLSHFCRTFQRTFGVRASAWITLSLRERQRKVQDLTKQTF